MKSRRARFYDIENYTPKTIRSYRNRNKPYVRAALAANEDPEHPASDWVRTYVDDLIRTKTPGEVRKQVNACGYFFRSRKLLNPFSDDTIEKRITVASLAERTGDARDAERAARLVARRRAEAFSERKMAAHTLYGYELVADAWKTCAAATDIDNLHPPLETLRTYIEALGDQYSARSVRSHLCGLSHYFRTANVPDLTRDDAIWQIIEGLDRKKPPQPRARKTVADVRTIVQAADPSVAMDVRDVVLILLTFFGQVSITRLLEVDRSRVVLDDSGVAIPLNERHRSRAFIGRVDEPELDCGVWMQRWLDVIGRNSGPLFPRARQGGWTTTPISKVSGCKGLRRLCARAGFNEPRLPEALRLGALSSAAEALGTVVASNHAGTRRANVAARTGVIDWSHRSITKRHARNTRRKPLTPRRRHEPAHDRT